VNWENKVISIDGIVVTWKVAFVSKHNWTFVNW